MSEKDIADARHAERVFQALSLDTPLAGCEQDNLADLMGEEDTQIEHTVQMQAVLAHWTDLPAREQRILLLRFYGNMNQAEIGEQLGISQMHVSRLLARALSHLRACLFRPAGEVPAS